MTTRNITLRDEFRITQNDDNTTLTAGSANTRSLAAEFVTPDRTGFVIRENDIFSLFLGTDPATAVADTTVVELVKADPNGIITRTIAKVDYVTLKEFQDRNLLYTIGQRIELHPEDRLQIYANGNLAFTTANTRFQISSVRLAQARL